MIAPPALRQFAREHASQIEAALGPIRPQPHLPPPSAPALFLCFTNRCGSNYLAQLLASTGLCNEAGEFFNAATVLEHAAARRLASLHDYVAALPDLVPRRPILAAKLGLDQLIMLADADLLAPSARFLLLERQDRLAQAISRVIASQTGAWSSAQAAAAAPRFDPAAIAEERARIDAANAGFYAFFAANRIAPFHTTYEALLAAPERVVADIGAWLGHPGLAPDPRRVTLRVQRNAVNAEWRRRLSA